MSHVSICPINKQLKFAGLFSSVFVFPACTRNILVPSSYRVIVAYKVFLPTSINVLTVCQPPLVRTFRSFALKLLYYTSIAWKTHTLTFFNILNMTRQLLFRCIPLNSAIICNICSLQLIFLNFIPNLKNGR